MPVIDANIEKESQERYLTYALSVITGRALPDVRDGLKPVQRRILFAAAENLRLAPDGNHRKSAAVVGEVLAKYHPHGDVACYEAMVRMAQDFSLRYPLIDGQGNFGSMDGDNAAAYRYTEVRLRPLALEVLGEIGEETVNFRDNFDSTTREPEVLPSRVPLLLINGASGIAVGMATNIPPHNLKDVVKALIELSRNPEVTDNRLASLIKGPDFPTGCLVLNSKSELQDIYRSGRGSVKMRGAWRLEDLGRGKQAVVVTSVPYGVNKAQLVEKIANLIVDRKVPQLVDIRDESTTDVRIILELAAGADAEVAMVYLYKHTPLESTFAVNFTVLVPTTEGGLRPELVSLRAALQHFLNFREIITTRRLQFEHRKLSARVHILEGLVLVFDALDEVIKIVRKSEGRSDAAQKLQKRFSLTNDQALAIVDMRIYQLSRTSAIELEQELTEKRSRMVEIESILAEKEKVRDLIRQDLERIATTYGDKRLSPLEERSDDPEFDESMYVVEEEVFAIVTRDGWVKRIRSNNDVNTTRIREGDAILSAHVVSTLDSVLFLTNFGSIFSLRVTELPSSSGFGTPLQKLLKFKDEERVVTCLALRRSQDSEAIQPGSYQEGSSLLLVSRKGLGCITAADGLVSLKKSGKRIMKLRDGDEVAVATPLTGKEVIIVTDKAQALKLKVNDIATREGASIGIVLIALKGEEGVVGAATGGSRTSFEIVSGARERVLTFTEVSFGARATRGQKLSGIGSVDAVKVIPSAAKE